MANNYTQAYTELSCLLKHFPKEYLDKIPPLLLKLINDEVDKQYIINIDTSKSLQSQNICKNTKKLLALIKYSYWSTHEEQEQLKQKLEENENKHQEELRKKYNPDNLFKNSYSSFKRENESKEMVALIDIKKVNWLEKMFNKIIKFFKFK